MSIRIKVNCVEHSVEAEAEMPLLWVLRDILGLTGTKYGCGEALCVVCTVHLNGQPVLRKRVDDFVSTDDFGVTRRVPRYLETLPGGRKHFILEESDNDPMDNTKVYRVPEGVYFAMGDNRDRSNDSRYSDVGFIPRENLVGRAEFLFFSSGGTIWKPWKWLDTVRFERIFQGIE